MQYQDINEVTLETILRNVLSDHSFEKKAKEMSVRFRDRPMSALDTAIFWVEYVIRNKGADYMKNPGRDLNWIVVDMIDIYVFILLIIIVFSYLVSMIVKKTFKYIAQAVEINDKVKKEKKKKR